MAKKRANGEGNIRKRKDGRWEGQYTAGYDEKTGKRLIKNVLGKTQAEVKEKLAKAVAEAESVDVRRADEYTLGTWLQTWYELYAKPHLRFSTAEYYRRGIWNLSADYEKANWLRCNGRTWTLRTKRFPSASRRDATTQANRTSRARKRKTRSEKSPSRRMPLICWSRSIRSIPATHGCSRHPRQAKCTTRIRLSTSTRKS